MDFWPNLQGGGNVGSFWTVLNAGKFFMLPKSFNSPSALIPYHDLGLKVEWYRSTKALVNV